MFLSYPVYGGYFGAGLGIILLAVIGLGVHDSQTRAQTQLKQATSFCVTVSAAMFFVFSAKVAWHAAAAMAVGALIGGVIGGRMAGRVGDILLYRIVVSVGSFVALVFFFRLFLSGLHSRVAC